MSSSHRVRLLAIRPAAWWERGLQTLRTLMGGVATFVLAATLPRIGHAQKMAPAATPVVFDGVTVVDVEHGTLLPTQRVVIVGNRIQAIGKADAITIPRGAQVVDAHGKYLIPGLWDMHLHTTAYIPYLMLIANGVTGMRDCWSYVPLDSMLRWRREILAGTRVGPPRQFLSGVALDDGSPCTRGPVAHACVADTADARWLIR